MYRVFSPFQRAWARLPVGTPLPAPERIPGHGSLRSERLPALGALGVNLDAEAIRGGETQAQQRLDAFLDEWSGSYHEARNHLGEPATSRLSADLHYGCVSPRGVLAKLDRRKPGHRAFATELAWRDFYAHVLHAWPEVRTSEFNPTLRALPWRREGEAFTAWKQGRTGYPVVDAGMRQLLAEGWMHNRARMITASFLCKDLLIDWRLGETHFLRHLVDGDLASNNGGWQWAAGTGTDAQPYFRIFNPVLQGQKFDRDGAYVRRYVPELRPVTDKWLHSPWEMPEEVQREVGVRIGRDYPAPIVDHAEARQQALDWFDEHGRG
jgi:deoxyribodipyrimidine photo-lyase